MEVVGAAVLLQVSLFCGGGCCCIAAGVCHCRVVAVALAGGLLHRVIVMSQNRLELSSSEDKIHHIIAVNNR